MFLHNYVFLSYVAIALAQIPSDYVPGEECNRACNGEVQSCYFEFHMETYLSMSLVCENCATNHSDCFLPGCVVAGGVQRPITVINKQMPGPAIEVCEGDRVRVLVRNTMETAEATTIHWHGQHMKKDPYMDGVPYVTQCPILFNNNFTYDFEATTPGTHFYHSHVEVQRGDGVYGSLIVRQQPENNDHKDLYDTDNSDHVILVTDWNDEPRIEVFYKMSKGGVFLKPTGMLVNGLGFQTDHDITGTPMANFNVKAGQTSRFRMINTNFFDCPYEISIDGHQMIVIATDGQDVEPVAVDAIMTHSGERYDFLINATQPVDTYWIRVKGHTLCQIGKTFVLATLTYKGSDKLYPDGPLPTYESANNATGLLLNPLSQMGVTQETLRVDELKSMSPLEDGIMGDDVKRFFLVLDMDKIETRDIHNFRYTAKAPVTMGTPQFNDISFKPLDFPLMSERHRVDKNLFCTSETVADRNCKTEMCACPHVLQVNKGDVVEMVMINNPSGLPVPISHPVHLHGNNYRVLTISEFDRPNVTLEEIRQNYDKFVRVANDRPPLKDNAAVPDNGLLVYRFVADTPGYWLMHCHVDIHAMMGMMLVLDVGDDNDMPDPPQGFPTCGNFLNPVN